MKTLTTILASCCALALLAVFFVAALVEVTFRGGKALDCGLESEEDAR